MSAQPRLHLKKRALPPSEGRVLVLLAHPALHRSRVNAALADAIRDLPGVTVHDLYEAWPSFVIDTDAEHALLEAHDHLVFQHPMHWYAAPALLKAWQEQVLTWGWAYGPGGDHLRGKRLLCGLSTGGPAEAYPTGEEDGVDALLAPVRRTARLCGLDWEPPFVVHGAHRLDAAGIEAAASAWRERVATLAGLKQERVH
jgi:putative NADPH-quinone reductase